ncbi:unnamed protein product, partial [Brenthis ino]
MSDQQSRSRKRKRDSSKDVLDAILARLNTLEERFATPPPQPSGLPLQVASTSLEHTPQPVQPALTGGATTDDVRDDDSTAGRASTLLTRESISTGSDTTGRIVEAITSLVKAVGKLDSCMRGPYKVLKRLPHHRYELELLAGSYGKRTEAAAENMVAWAGEWTPETCAAFFESESDDSMHDTSVEAETSSSVEHSRVADEDDRPSGEAVLNEDE